MINLVKLLYILGTIFIIFSYIFILSRPSKILDPTVVICHYIIILAGYILLLIARLSDKNTERYIDNSWSEKEENMFTGDRVISGTVYTHENRDNIAGLGWIL